MNGLVYVGKIDGDIAYPDDEYFAPSEKYPEYPFSEIATKKNSVYDLVREGFHQLGFDKEHFNTPEWNPLSHIIKKGDVVVIKPNMVIDRNFNLKGGMDCMITHPSIIRAVTDYVYIALQGTGKIIIADAPVQDCNFNRLIMNCGHSKLIEFYAKYSVNVQLCDLREDQYQKHIENHRTVDLSRYSLFEKDNSFNRELRISNYNPEIVKQHHTKEKNEYAIAPQILDADVIINIPKPKTHRFAGVTISLKNMVGINANKAWIPHYSAGCKENHGDEYPFLDSAKKMKSRLLDEKGKYYPLIKKWRLTIPANYLIHIYDKYIIFRTKLGLSKNTWSGGCWYGNDTIWRMILDLNMLVRYADKTGKLMDSPQRKIFNIADMVIAGEGQGPLSPSPQKTGMIVMSEDTVCLDEVVSTLMGIDYSYIPTIRNARLLNDFSICSSNKAIIVSNAGYLNGKKCKELDSDDVFHFNMASGWEEYNK